MAMLPSTIRPSGVQILDTVLKYAAVGTALVYVTGLGETVGYLRFAVHLTSRVLPFNTANILYKGALLLGVASLPIFLYASVTYLTATGSSSEPIRKERPVLLTFLLLGSISVMAILMRYTGSTVVEIGILMFAFLFWYGVAFSALSLYLRGNRALSSDHLMVPIVLFVTSLWLGITNGYVLGHMKLRTPPSTQIWLKPDAAKTSDAAGLQMERSGCLSKPVILIQVGESSYYVLTPDGRVLEISKDQVVGVIEKPGEL